MLRLRDIGLRHTEHTDVAPLQAAVDVVGFDDVSLACHLTPSLTTVYAPIEEPVRAGAPLVRPVDLRAPPVVGSALLAMEADGVQISIDIWRRLSAGAIGKSELVAQYPLHSPVLPGG